MKEIEIFKIVPDNFFSVLSSPNKIIYMRIISLIYSLVQNGLSYGIDKITNIKVYSKLFTIENLTSFNDFNLDGAVIYLGGFHNKVRGNLLSKIYRSNENIKCYHFGDIDVGGFKILNNLRNKTNIPFIPYKMDVDTLVKYKDYCKELTQNDKKEIKKMISDVKYFEFKDVLEKMLSFEY